MAADHYRLLGVPREADTAEIRAAYLRLMRSCHPDVRPGDLAAAEVARQANLAWNTLGDPIRRAAYDRQLAATTAASAAADASAPPSQAAYLRQRQEYGRAFHLACLRVAAAVFACGVLALALIEP